MTVTIDLRPEVEAGLAVLAAREGITLAQYVRRLLEDQMPGYAPPPLSPNERASFWREAVKSLPHTPPLSDEAISREAMYDGRG